MDDPLFLFEFPEPFDPALWLLVCLVGIQVYSLAIFSFEWLSPLGFNMKVVHIHFYGTQNFNLWPFLVFLFHRERPALELNSHYFEVSGSFGLDCFKPQCTLTLRVDSQPSKRSKVESLIISQLFYCNRVVVHVWSMFAVVFLATYTANLAVFMITREESHEFVGIHDSRVSVSS